MRWITPVVVLLIFIGPVLADQKDEDLIGAAEVGDLVKMQTLLAQGADPNFQDSFGKTALTNVQTVIGYGDGNKQIQAILFLLAHGANVDGANANGDTPLIVAAGNGGNRDQSENEIAVVKLLLEHGAKVNAANDLKITALHIAAFRGYLESIKILLAHGADRQAHNTYGETPVEMMKQNPMLDDAVRKQVVNLLAN
jgi:ankyrin repeat protein